MILTYRAKNYEITTSISRLPARIIRTTSSPLTNGYKKFIEDIKYMPNAYNMRNMIYALHRYDRFILYKDNIV